jgi:hypothetical protein
MGRKSISQQLRQYTTLARRQKVLAEWITSWQQDQFDLIKQLEQAIKTDNYDNLCIATGQLKEVTLKRFEGLNNVIKILLENHANEI